MEIHALCPYRVGTLFWEAQPGQLSLSVTVNATFTFVHEGEAALAIEQLAPGEDEHWDGNVKASIYRPSDEVPLKRRVDVLLSGHACAPAGEPVETLVAKLRVGDLEKAIRVTGDRLWTRASGEAGGELVVGPASPFTRLPIRYERAAQSADNPVGIDISAPPAEGAPAQPNLEPLSPGASPAFGVLSPTWPARRRLLNEASLAWAAFVSAKTSVGPVPPGFDFEFFNVAPREQQLEMLRAGVVIALEGMHPSHARIETRLPPIRPQVFRVHPVPGRAEEIVLRCDTLWIDADRSLITLSFRGLTDVGGMDKAAVGKLIIVADPQGKRLRFDRVEKMFREQAPESAAKLPQRSASRPVVEEGAEDPLAVRHDAVKGGSPGRPGDPSSDLSAEIAAAEIAAAEAAAAEAAAVETEHAKAAPVESVKAAPAERAQAAEAPAVESGPPSPADKREPAPPVAPVKRETVPTLPSTSTSSAAPAPAPAPPFAEVEPSTRTPLPSVSMARISPVAPIAPLPPDADEDDDEYEQTQDVVRSPGRPPRPAATPVRDAGEVERAKVAPPAAAPPSEPRREANPETDPDAITAEKRRRPRATVPPLVQGTAESGGLSAPRSSQPPVAPDKGRSVPPPAFGPSQPEPPQLSIEAYAAISAELAQKGADRASVLRGHALTPAAWAVVDRYWTRAIAEQTERGERALLASFDAVYVATQEKVRRPIGVSEYARILIGLERGDVGRVLTELELQLGDLMRLQRVWTKRTTEDAELAEALRRATEEARGT